MTRSFLAIVVFILWILLSVKTCNDWKSCCGSGGETTEAVSGADTKAATGVAEGREDAEVDASDKSRAARVVGPAMFNWSQTDPILNDNWATYKQQLIDNLGDDKILEITGLYSEEEGNVGGAENLGLARAGAIKKLFADVLPDERINLLGRIRDAVDGDRTNPFIAVGFGSKDPEVKEKIIEIGNRIDIYFPTGSNERLQDREIEDYLSKMADRLNKTGEKVRITGHTDNTGAPETNLALGQARANVIRNYLISKDVPSAQIITISRGESQPVASNATESGKAKNRRAEVQIIN